MKAIKSDFLDGLNAEQRIAVSHETGPMLVLAGAGTGKTRVLTRRIASLISVGIKPEKILALTFTRKAAAEMKHRVLELVGDRSQGTKIGTFHSLAMEIVRDHGYRIGLSPKFRIGVDLSFDKLVILAAKLLAENESVRAEFRERFRFVMVDEFQDTNVVQFKILCSLMTEENNLFVVGDDDQSIYSFQGASRELIRSFGTHFPAAKLVTLHRNYRCSKSVVRLANSITAKASDRFEKQLTACREVVGSVQFSRLNSSLNERRFILDAIRQFRESNFDYSEIAILVRSHSVGSIIGAYLDSNSVKIKGEGGIKILTLHSSKGLEFPIVFIPALEEGRLPHFAAVNSGHAAIEEERRLFYVGITRARDHLVLSCAMERNSRTQFASQFLRSIPRAHLNSS